MKTINSAKDFVVGRWYWLKLKSYPMNNGNMALHPFLPYLCSDTSIGKRLNLSGGESIWCRHDADVVFTAYDIIGPIKQPIDIMQIIYMPDDQ